MALRKKSTNYSFVPYAVKRVNPTGNIRNGQPLPKPRSGHRCVANNNNLYSFGGFNPWLPPESRLDGVDWTETTPLFRELWKFNYTIECWTKMKITGTIPTKLASHSAVLRGNLLLTFGGTGVPFGSSSSNKVYICDLKTLEWKEVKTSGDQPQEQYGQAVALKDNRLYVVGGTTGFEYTMDIHCLKLNTNKWLNLRTQNNYFPKERYRHEIALIGDSIYVFGGGTTNECFTFKKISSFNTKSHRWSHITTHPDQAVPRINPREDGYPSRRRCHSLVQQGTDVFIYGGFNGSRIFSDFWRLNTETHSWRMINARVPLPTYFHSAALTPKGRMYVYGGVHDIVENLRTSDIYSVWLTIPKLKDICWEAVLHYHRDWIVATPKANLLKEGIPKEYVDSVEIQAECG